MSRTIKARKGGPRRRGRAWAACAVLVPMLAALAGTAPVGAEPADRSRLYAIHHTGLLCGLPPCFSYCARTMATGEDGRFSRLALPPGQERLLEDARPAIVEGTFREVDGGARRGLELHVSRVVGRATEPALPQRCPL